MINYVFLFFLPGSAGNFFSRCLALASDNCYAWVGSQAPNLHMDLDEKFQLYRYGDADLINDWISFEHRLSHYSKRYPHHDLPEGSCSIWPQHPDAAILDRNISGPHDRQHVFYIDPSENFEWCVMNALYKNSVIDVRWMVQGRKMLEDATVSKINLSDIIASSDSTLRAVEQVCTSVGVSLEDTNREKIQRLWQEWICTTLPAERFRQFKDRIGYWSS